MVGDHERFHQKLGEGHSSRDLVTICSDNYGKKKVVPLSTCSYCLIIAFCFTNIAFYAFPWSKHSCYSWSTQCLSDKMFVSAISRAPSANISTCECKPKALCAIMPSLVIPRHCWITEHFVLQTYYKPIPSHCNEHVSAPCAFKLLGMCISTLCFEVAIEFV